MNAVRKKLREKSGVSILIGLMFLIVCLTVGTIVLTASTAAAGKLARQRQSEQDYMDVASAARLLKKRIGVLTFKHTHVEVRIDGFLSSSSDTPELTASPAGDIILKNELMELCGILTPSSPPPAPSPPAEKKFQIFKETAAASGEGKVYGSMKMEADGRILVKLWLGSEDVTNTKNHNHVEIEFGPDGPVETTEVTSVEDGDTGEITETTTVTTTCSWPEDRCTIKKGTS